MCDEDWLGLNSNFKVGDLIYIKELKGWYKVETNGITKGIWVADTFCYYPEIFNLNDWHITEILGDKENE